MECLTGVVRSTYYMKILGLIMYLISYIRLKLFYSLDAVKNIWTLTLHKLTRMAKFKEQSFLGVLITQLDMYLI